MTFQLTWLLPVLKAAGLTVKEAPGWQTRGVDHEDMGKIEGVICHHTACHRGTGDMPTEHSVIVGRLPPDPHPLSGPLCHILLGRLGDCELIAAGKANHAGHGTFAGFVNIGNTRFIGIEAENDGIGEPWSEAELESYAKICAAICKHLGLPASRVIAHREWTPRKIDPTGIDMVKFRAHVAELMK